MSTSPNGQAVVVDKSNLTNPSTNGNQECQTNGLKQSTSGIAGFENVRNDDAQQYLNNYKAHRQGISHEEMITVYTEWANNYDKDLCPGVYNGPEIAAEHMALYYPDLAARASLSILDVAAGTGRVGSELQKKGFKKIDALEPSSGMMEILKGRNAYEKHFECSIGPKRTEGIQTNSYDALVIAGGMGEGHIPVKALDEMIRVVKPGGNIFIVMREEYLSYVKEYVGKLEPHMNSLVDKGQWGLVSRVVVPEYSFLKNGVVFNYQVLVDQVLDEDVNNGSQE